MQHQTCTSCANHPKNNNGGFLPPHQLHPTLDVRTVRAASYRSSYIPTPVAYRRKNLIINVYNFNDYWCVLYATLSKQLCKSLRERKDRSRTYKPYLFTLKIEGLSFPLPLHQIERYESMNNITVNVYMVQDDGGVVTPMYLSKRAQDDPYNFLMIVSKDDSTKWHYAWIQDLDRLLKLSEDWRRNLNTLTLNRIAL